MRLLKQAILKSISEAEGAASFDTAARYINVERLSGSVHEWSTRVEIAVGCRIKSVQIII